MLSIENNSLRFNFTDLHPNATCTVEFQRTLRIPDDGNKHPLPPGLGGYPLHHIDDYADRIPDQWHRRGGVMMPMYQSEALWLNFNSSGYPFACKVAAGKINAVTGEIWQDHLNTDPQDYMVVPDQPWLDGFCVDKGSIRQFVAMPLGEGYSAEEQITGAAEYGGIQIVVYPLKADRFEKFRKKRQRDEELRRRRARNKQLKKHKKTIAEILDWMAKATSDRTAHAKIEFEEILKAYENDDGVPEAKAYEYLQQFRHSLIHMIEGGCEQLEEALNELDRVLMSAEFREPVPGSPDLSIEAQSMGLAPGGSMVQEIFGDSYGLDAWDQRSATRCFVTLANSGLWAAITTNIFINSQRF